MKEKKLYLWYSPADPFRHRESSDDLGRRPKKQGREAFDAKDYNVSDRFVGL
jgi:hypothetical protein